MIIIMYCIIIITGDILELIDVIAFELISIISEISVIYVQVAYV